MAKDLRTDLQTSGTQGVLDGDLDAFMGAAEAQRVGSKRTGVNWRAARGRRGRPMWRHHPAEAGA